MSNIGKTRLKGHALRDEGAGFRVNCTTPERVWSNPGGRAMCSCGAISDWFANAATRKRWHKDHKNAIRAATPEPK